ncbi:hypothetical protein NCS57_01069100 [Fusarium keratoplasticum]|uniref:Uncharacterized protein n=1 Tax=Fusarium keratoplasticum TaxID=1328300 RepID=A0ACC0QRS1_9HYPO|nr:hypothetical protein NCS57_01069100 [Fusarium keratoplasticum]KAI8660905.1 hypothetical protein NCS57_01069100 [Fusarium keratoplasticum]
MKATFFSVFALAISAIASPVPQVNGAVGQVNGVVKSTTDIVTKKVGVKQIVDEATAAKRAIADPQVLITTLKTTVHKVNGQTTGINEIVEKVKSGALTKDAGATQAVPMFEAVHFELTEVVTKLTGAAGLNVADVDVDTVLSLVVVLVSEVLTTVKTVVTVIGLRPQLISILHSVFTILAKVLTLVIGIVGAIVPGLIAALTPLLAGLGNAVLAPVLAPITAFLAGIAAA